MTWEPDLSGAVKAREDEAHVLVSTAAATNVIADSLVARQDVIDKGPTTLRDFVHGWFDGIDSIAKDPAGRYAVDGQGAQARRPTTSRGMLSGLKLTPFADNALFFGLTGAGEHAQFRTLFDTAFIVWRKEGVISKAVDAKDYVDTRFVAALADQYQGQKVVEPFRFDPKEAKNPKRARHRQQVAVDLLHARLGRDHERLVLHARFARRHHDRLRQHVPAHRRQHRHQGLAEAEQVALAEARRQRDEVPRRALHHSRRRASRRSATARTIPSPTNDTEAGRQQNRRTDIKVILNAQ